MRVRREDARERCLGVRVRGLLKSTERIGLAGVSAVMSAAVVMAMVSRKTRLLQRLDVGELSVVRGALELAG